MSAAFQAPAKINPVLRVLGRGDDGYHELVTVMLALDLAGEVSVERAGGGTGVEVKVGGPCASVDIPTDGSNLAARAALAVRELLGRDDPLRVILDKRVPSRAGLGGGSSDAVAAAHATWRLLTGRGGPEDAPERRTLAAALAAIGTDCAFFHGARGEGAAVATGTGTDIDPVAAVPSWWISLVTPDVECATREVYDALDWDPGTYRVPHGGGVLSSSPSERHESARALLRSSADEARAALVNDLEPAARRAYPALGAWFGFVAGAGLAPMTLAGSGASLFGIHDSEAEAEDAVARLVAAAARAGAAPRFQAVTRPAGERR